MEKLKKGVALCLALLLTVALTAVSVSAKGLDPVTFATDYVKAYQYLITHPKQVAQLAVSSLNREQMDPSIAESDGGRALLRFFSVPTTAGTITKATAATLNPTNSENNRIPSLRIDGPKTFPVQNTDSFSPQFTLLTTPYSYKNTINIDPLFAYKTNNNELVVWGVIKNFSGKNVEIDGIPEISLSANNKILASGTSSNFDSPMKFSYYRTQLNSGVYNGLPTQCFVKLTFEPGTYDSTIDITSLDNLECQYSLNYGYLE